MAYLKTSRKWFEVNVNVPTTQNSKRSVVQLSDLTVVATVTLVIKMKKKKKPASGLKKCLFFITLNIADNGNIHDYLGEADFRKCQYGCWSAKDY